MNSVDFAQWWWNPTEISMLEISVTVRSDIRMARQRVIKTQSRAAFLVMLRGSVTGFLIPEGTLMALASWTNCVYELNQILANEDHSLIKTWNFQGILMIRDEKVY